MRCGRGLVIQMLRGNVDTRLRKLDEGQYDAIVLAAAGLRRLGLAGPHSGADSGRDHVSGGGPGRAGDRNARRRRRGAEAGVEAGSRGSTRSPCTAERALLATLGGGCQVPDRRACDALTGRRSICARSWRRPTERASFAAKLTGADAERHRRGARAREMLAQGAREILARSLRAHESVPGGRGSRRSRPDHRERPQDPGARRLRALR